MFDFAIVNKHKEEIDNIINHFICPSVFNSDNLNIKEYLLFADHSPPRITLEYKDEKSSNTLYKNGIEIVFYKDKTMDQCWQLELNGGVLSLLRNIPDLNNAIEDLFDIHSLYTVLTSLTTPYKLNGLGDLHVFKKGVDFLRDANTCGVFSKLSIDPFEKKITKIEFECDLINYITSNALDSELFSFHSYIVEQNLLTKNKKIELTRKNYKCYKSLNGSPKLVTSTKEIFEEKDNKNFIKDFKSALVKSLFSETEKTLETNVENIKLKDLQYLKLLSY